MTLKKKKKKMFLERISEMEAQLVRKENNSV